MHLFLSIKRVSVITTGDYILRLRFRKSRKFVFFRIYDFLENLYESAVKSDLYYKRCKVP